VSKPDASAEFTCVHSERCGGCAYMNVPMSEQLARKAASVREAFAGYAALRELPVASVTPAEPALGYRTRAKLIASPEGALGLFERAGHTVVDIPHCRVLHPRVAEVVAEVRARAKHLEGALTGLDARVVHGARAGSAAAADEPAAVLLTLAGPPRTRARLEALARELAALPSVLGVALRMQNEGAVQQLEGVPEPVAGSAVVRDRLDSEGVYHYATFGSFVQAHRGQAAQLARTIVERLRQVLGELRGARVLELFAGSGALGLSLAALGAELTLVERYVPALEHAQRARDEQALGTLAAISGDAEQVLAALRARSARFDAVIVNPPRRGLPPALRAQLAGLAPRCVVYVSCEPTTLARDLADLAHHGLRTQGVTPFDMIPLSAGVEALALLTPGERAPIEVLFEDEQTLVVDKPPHLPTVPDAAHATSLLERLQRERALPELTPVHRLDVGTSGVCIFAKHKRAVPLLAAGLAGGEKHYIALVRGAARAKGIVRAALREQGQTRDAVSRYTRAARVGPHSLVRVRPEQGRTHQVRKHMAAIGHPVLGDARYGDGPSNRFFEHRHGLDRTFLHARRVLLQLGEQAPLVFEAPLAADLEAVLASAERG
jgi:23S rRNA (uracil1939-C5)-methyltransferase